jgi:hypothetical protein
VFFCIGNIMQDIEAFIDDLPKDEQVILKRLRALILQTDPRIREKLSYGVPYFARHRRLFFLWPASAVPCPDHRIQAPPPPKVTLGFCYGNLLSNVQGFLSPEGRKQVYTLGVSSLTQIDEQLLCEIFYEAILVDDQFFKTNNK